MTWVLVLFAIFVEVYFNRFVYRWPWIVVRKPSICMNSQYLDKSCRNRHYYRNLLWLIELRYCMYSFLCRWIYAYLNSVNKENVRLYRMSIWLIYRTFYLTSGGVEWENQLLRLVLPWAPGASAGYTREEEEERTFNCMMCVRCSDDRPWVEGDRHSATHSCVCTEGGINPLLLLPSTSAIHSSALV